MQFDVKAVQCYIEICYLFFFALYYFKATLWIFLSLYPTTKLLIWLNKTFKRSPSVWLKQSCEIHIVRRASGVPLPATLPIRGEERVSGVGNSTDKIYCIFEF